MAGSNVQDLVILGSGPAGLTAAIYSARANLSPLVIEGDQPGGQLTMTSEVENFPGFPEGILGTELMEHLKKQAARFGATYQSAELTEVNLRAHPFELKFSDGNRIATRALIIATGAKANWLQVPGEEKLLGRGVSSCATCDGFFFKGKEIVVVGGGDSAMEEATFLTRFAKCVTVIHRKNHFRASKVMVEKAQKNPKIKFLMSSVVQEILGTDAVEGVKLLNLETHQDSVFPCEAVFVAIGHSPNTSLFRGQIDLDEKGYIQTKARSMHTSRSGVFAAGDVQDSHYRQAITAAGSGCQAAMDAEKYLDEAHA